MRVRTALVVWILILSVAACESPQPRIETQDGAVYARASQDGRQLELVLERGVGASTVLVSIPEPVPPAGVSFGSLHVVDCPPATGLAQRYYAVGQEAPAQGAISIGGLAGAQAQMASGRYLVVVQGEPAEAATWSVMLDGNRVAGGLGSGFLDLERTGEESAFGCYFS